MIICLVSEHWKEFKQTVLMTSFFNITHSHS